MKRNEAPCKKQSPTSEQIMERIRRLYELRGLPLGKTTAGSDWNPAVWHISVTDSFDNDAI